MGRSNLGSNQGNEKPIRPVPNHTKTGLLMRQMYVPPSKWPTKKLKKNHTYNYNKYIQVQHITYRYIEVPPNSCFIDDSSPMVTRYAAFHVVTTVTLPGDLRGTSASFSPGKGQKVLNSNGRYIKKKFKQTKPLEEGSMVRNGFTEVCLHSGYI